MTSLYLPRVTRWLLQSPPAEWAVSWIRDLLIGALRQGPVPQHVAFVMDGNRRFARQHQIETIEGHNLGFEALARILDVCYRIGVKVVTIYTFSLENFKRPKYEVDGLMEMGRLKLSQLSQHGELLHRYGARIKIVGQRGMIPDDMMDSVRSAIDITKGNDRAILNICFPYTSREEMTQAIRSTVADYSKPLGQIPPTQRTFSEHSIARNIRSRRLSILREEDSPPDTHAASSHSPALTVHNNSLGPATSSASDQASRSSGSNKEEDSSLPSSDVTPDTSHTQSPDRAGAALENGAGTASRPQQSHRFPDPESITAATLNDRMYTADAPPLDLLVRTSGVERLSDFMLWQCHEHTSIKFLTCLWPEFDLWRFLPVLIEWQWWRGKMERESAVAAAY